MKKNVILATAVASLLASGIAAADVKLGGIVQMTYKDGNTTGADEGSVVAGDVNLNASSSAKLDNGNTAFANYRLDADNVSGNGLTGDSVHVGIKGGFGTFQMGEVSLGTSLGDFAGDINGDHSPAANAAMSYSNTFGAVKMHVAYQPTATTGGDDGTSIGFQFGGNGFTVGAGSTDNGATNTTVVGVKGSFSGLSVAFQAGDINDVAANALKLGYSAGKFSADYTVANLEDTDDDANSRLNLNYSLGGGTTLNFRSHTDGGNDQNDYSRVSLAHKF